MEEVSAEILQEVILVSVTQGKIRFIIEYSRKLYLCL